MPPEPTHVPEIEVVPHQQVEGGTRPRPDVRHGGGAVPQETGTQVCALLCLLLEQELGELVDDRALGGEDTAHDLRTRVAAHQVEEDLQCLHVGGYHVIIT